MHSHTNQEKDQPTGIADSLRTRYEISMCCVANIFSMPRNTVCNKILEFENNCHCH